MAHESIDDLDFDMFVEAFIARLVERGVASVSPGSPETNRSLYRVCDLLAEEVERSDRGGYRTWVRSVRNQLAPGNLGTFDAFFSTLRSKQIGHVASPNFRYRDVNFKISPAYAQALLSELDPEPRQLVNRAVDEFLKHSATS